MNRSEANYAADMLALLRSKYRVRVRADWGLQDAGSGNAWRRGTWSKAELVKLQSAITLLADVMGGAKKFKKNLGRVTAQKSEMGTHGGEALAHQVSLSTRGTFSAWTVVHEMAHAWDANHEWKCSLALEKYTGGYTNNLFSLVRKLFGKSDCGLTNYEEKPGRRGRLPGCNAAGYFYGDQPSGSNWSFNRAEDFAESVAMYAAWGRQNQLSPWAEARVDRYLMKNGANVKNFGVDNWADYAEYFYPPAGDYSRTKRWKFVDGLVRGQIDIE